MGEGREKERGDDGMLPRLMDERSLQHQGGRWRAGRDGADETKGRAEKWRKQDQGKVEEEVKEDGRKERERGEMEKGRD